MLRFLLVSRPSRYLKSIDVQASLMHLSRSTLTDMLEHSGLVSTVQNNGALHLYQNGSFYRKDLKYWAFRQDHGIDFETDENQTLQKFQQGLSNDFIAGLFVPEWQTISNPAGLCLALHEKLSGCGVTTYISEAEKIDLLDGITRVRLSDGKFIYGFKIVIVAGAWSARLST